MKNIIQQLIISIIILSWIFLPLIILIVPMRLLDYYCKFPLGTILYILIFFNQIQNCPPKFIQRYFKRKKIEL